MSNFKPMVKMYTDEPAVSLKLKKGGKVHHKGAKHHKEHHEEHGHKAMHHAHGGMHHAFESEAGHAPKKPSHAARHKAMNPNLYAKGGKVAHKVMGGGMPMGAPQGMPGMTGVGMGSPTMPRAMRPSAIANMAPNAQAQRAAMVKKALLGMKKGGTADHKHIEALEKELHHHESMSMDQAHHKKHGGMAHHAHGGKVHHMTGHAEGTHEHHKAMAKHYAEKCKDGGTPHMHKMHEHHKHMAKMCKGGKYAEGGAIDKDMTKTTLKNSVKPFVSRADTSRPDHSPAHTGDIKKTNAGGYKHGGTTGGKTPMYKTKEYAKGGRTTGTMIPSETNESETRGKIKFGGTIEGNEHYYENTDMHSARPDHSKGKTGQVHMSNAGGYKHGGKAHHKMHHKADGGAIDKYQTRNTIEGGDWENRPADTTPPGKKNTVTGVVKLSNAGGYKHGGHASKKAYATGGNVNDMGKSVKMPLRIKHPPVANSLQSGTYKKGGKVKKFDDGGSSYDAKYTVKDPKAVSDKASRELEDAMNPLSMAKELYGKAKNYFNPPAGSVTKTEKSVTVAPGRKHGGRARK